MSYDHRRMQDELIARAVAEGAREEVDGNNHRWLVCPNGFRVMASCNTYGAVKLVTARLRSPGGLLMRDEHEVKRRPAELRQPRRKRNDTSATVGALAHLRAEVPQGKVKGSLRVEDAPEPEYSEVTKRLLKELIRPKRWDMGLADARRMLREGYSLDRVAQVTGYDKEVLTA